jgi:murein DD-endopeptidase MepM/ murein hydrolase activator NlpD
MRADRRYPAGFGSVRRVAPRNRRAPWVLAGLAIVVTGLVVAGTVVERRDLTAAGAPSPTWASSAPGGGPSAVHAPAPAQPTTPPTRPRHYVFPVGGNVTYEHTHHDYPATDIIAACGSTVRATTDGVILEINRVDRWNPATDLGPERGGLSVSLLGDDGVRYYGSHMRMIGRNIVPGVRVKAGQTLGEVGMTGDAAVCHLHYGISPLCGRTRDWWIRRGEVWPWTFLDSWRKGGQLSPVAAVASWHKAHGCPPVTGIPEP